MKHKRILGTVSATSLVLIGLVFASPAQATVLSCGDIIATPNTTVVLTADIGPCTTPFGVAIIADNVTLDLNGHTVSGDGFQPADQTANVGVYVTSVTGSTANDVTVKNGTVTGFNSGVFLEDVNRATVTRMRLVDNIGPDQTDLYGEGLQVYLGGSHVVQGNQVVHNGPFAGMDFYQTSNNTITGNQVANNNILDTSGHHGGGGPIMQDIGIWVVNLSTNPANATNNTVSGNQVSGNGLDGIQIANYTNGNFVRSNSVSNNGFGQPAGNGFRDGDGIAIFGSSNLVETNTVNNNGGNGIGVEGSGTVNGKNNTIRSNRALGNGSAPNTTAFDLLDRNVSPPCDNNIWTSNIFGTRNQTCIN